MIGSGDGDGVDVFVFKERANVEERFRARQAHFLDVAEALVQDIFVNIAESGEFDSRDMREAADVVVATAAHPADSDADAIVCAENLAAQSQSGCAHCDCFPCRLKEFTPFNCHGCHLCFGNDLARRILHPSKRIRTICNKEFIFSCANSFFSRMRLFLGRPSRLQSLPKTNSAYPLLTGFAATLLFPLLLFVGCKEVEVNRRVHPSRLVRGNFTG
jgi:hypothetical protein